jgi:hypothetical protein
LGAAAFLMAQTPLKSQAWKPPLAAVELSPASSNAAPRRTFATLKVPGLDLRQTRIVWEAQDHEPTFGPTFSFTPPAQGAMWLEAEAQWPDGRRVVAVTNITPSTFSPGK